MCARPAAVMMAREKSLFCWVIPGREAGKLKWSKMQMYVAVSSN